MTRISRAGSLPWQESRELTLRVATRCTGFKLQPRLCCDATCRSQERALRCEWRVLDRVADSALFAADDEHVPHTYELYEITRL